MQIEDLDPMPFGAHKGKPMQDVPARYLHWLWHAGKKFDRTCPVVDYIRRKSHVLKVEHPDGIWE